MYFLSQRARQDVKVALNQVHIALITEHFRKAGKKEKKKAADLPLDQRLGNYIIEGTKDGLIADLDLKRAEGAGHANHFAGNDVIHHRVRHTAGVLEGLAEATARCCRQPQVRRIARHGM